LNAIKLKIMPEKKTLKKAAKDKREGKSASTQAGEFVHEEIDQIRKGKHGASSAKQAIAIGLSKARRAGVDLKPPKKGTVSEKSRRSAKSAYDKGQKGEPVDKKRSAASKKALKDKPRSAASHQALQKQGRSAAAKRSAADRSASAKKAARTRKRSASAKKTSRTRARS
jgi:hypothetical protein